jgi:hypothetical protein
MSEPATQPSAPTTQPAPELYSPQPAEQGDFVPPYGRPPRERYRARAEEIEQESAWGGQHITVVRLATVDEPDTVVAEYDRNYRTMFHTFEPFRQDGHDYALISTHYTATAVLDLESGEIVAREAPSSFGFCPRDFWVPDWREVHDQPPYTQDFPVQESAKYRDEWWPRGDFGFVAGCVWGDDGFDKVQFLDLSRIREGIITRDDRFGYFELAPSLRLSQAVVLELETGCVHLAALTDFDLGTGQLHDATVKMPAPETKPELQPKTTSES